MRVSSGLAAGFLLVAFALGCGDKSPTQPLPVLSDSIGTDAGVHIAWQAGLARKFTTHSFMDLPWDPVDAEIAAPRGLRAAMESCPIYGDSTDSDGDGIPNDFTVTWLADHCTSTRDSVTVQFSGRIRIMDHGTGFIIRYENLRMRWDHLNGYSFEVGQNGSRLVSIHSMIATLHEDVVANVEARVHSTVNSINISRNWFATYESAGEELSLDTVFPDGNLTLGGRATWNRNGVALALRVTTPAPLVRDADCTSRRDIISGRLRMHATGPPGAATIDAQFVGCGMFPVITVAAIPAP